MADDSANLRVAIADADTVTCDLFGGVAKDLGIECRRIVSISEDVTALKSLRHKEIDIVKCMHDTVETRLRAICQHPRSLIEIAADAGSDHRRMMQPAIAWDRKALP